MEALVMFREAYRNKTVWVSGATGFKGSWLCEWLLSLGARVHGYSLPPGTEPALFDQLGLADRIENEIADVRDAQAVRDSIERTQPDFVFHLAAQPLVRRSYQAPVETYAVNVMGTAHVLEGLRGLLDGCSAVLVTTDKCYDNREWVYGYREEDPLGGWDPYSSSKAAAELAIQAWRLSFLNRGTVRIASARAGNVIGGGDWASDRIVPDCIRALQAGKPIGVRNRAATRPWQHVLEPLSGYLWLGALLSSAVLAHGNDRGAAAYNFGPAHDSNRSVGELVEEILRNWPGKWEEHGENGAPHEAALLQLSTDKAHARLGWRPVWSFAEAVRETVRWYRCAGQSSASDSPRDLVRQQICEYGRQAASAGAPWSDTKTWTARTN
jgi:CDP-glucose 4,6-dehydratase